MDYEYRDPRPDKTAVLYPDELRPPPPPRRASFRKKRIIAGLAILVAVGLIGGIAAFAYVDFRLGEVRRVTPEGLVPVTGPMTVLLVGSDSRADLEPGQDNFGTAQQVSGKRSDTLMVVRTNPRERSATVLSIPRDLYVPIAGTGRSSRINSAYAGGPERLIKTITEALGVPINHYVEMNFDGFRGIVEAIGGLDVPFPAPAQDILAELDVPTAGCVHLSGEQGLAYVRSRQYESLEDGRWKSDPTSDFGRIQRQQDVIRRMVKKAVSRAARNPVIANDLLGSFVQHVTMDAGLSSFDLLRLGASFRSSDAGGLQMFTLPATGVRIAGAAVLELRQPEAAETLQSFLNPPPARAPGDVAVSPSAVRVQVLNGSGRTGEAGAAAGPGAPAVPEQPDCPA